MKNSKNKHKNHEKPQNLGQKRENSPQKSPSHAKNTLFFMKNPFFSKKYDGSYRNFQNTGSKTPFLQNIS